MSLRPEARDQHLEDYDSIKNITLNYCHAESSKGSGALTVQSYCSTSSTTTILCPCIVLDEVEPSNLVY